MHNESLSELQLLFPAAGEFPSDCRITEVRGPELTGNFTEG